MAQVASYVLQFQGTTPANPKDAEGDVWVKEGSENTKTEATEDNSNTAEEVVETVENVVSNN
jgi:cytochrome c oxidase cbb3-type subunit 3